MAIKVDNIKAQMRKGILEYCILSIISRGDSYASAIISELKAAEMIVVEGTLYPILYRLEDDGLIEAVWQQETGRAAPRKIYSATEKGREENERRLGLWAGFRTAVDHFCGEDAGHE